MNAGEELNGKDGEGRQPRFWATVKRVGSIALGAAEVVIGGSIVAFGAGHADIPVVVGGAVLIGVGANRIRHNWPAAEEASLEGAADEQARWLVIGRAAVSALTGCVEAGEGVGLAMLGTPAGWAAGVTLMGAGVAKLGMALYLIAAPDRLTNTSTEA